MCKQLDLFEAKTLDYALDLGCEPINPLQTSIAVIKAEMERLKKLLSCTNRVEGYVNFDRNARFIVCYPNWYPQAPDFRTIKGVKDQPFYEMGDKIGLSWAVESSRDMVERLLATSYILEYSENILCVQWEEDK